MAHGGRGFGSESGEEMSEKTLGQVAFEAWSNETWEFNQGQHHRWERAAQAVVAELVADVRSPESKAALAVVGALLKAEGAAEERERIADWLHSEMDEQLSDEVRSGEHDKWLRAGGKS